MKMRSFGCRALALLWVVVLPACGDDSSSSGNPSAGGNGNPGAPGGGTSTGGARMSSGGARSSGGSAGAGGVIAGAGGVSGGEASVAGGTPSLGGSEAQGGQAPIGGGESSGGSGGSGGGSERSGSGGTTEGVTGGSGGVTGGSSGTSAGSGGATAVGGTVEGWVRTWSGSAVPSALVHLGAQLLRTDAQGHFQGTVGAPRIFITSEADGYSSGAVWANAPARGVELVVMPMRSAEFATPTEGGTLYTPRSDLEIEFPPQAFRRPDGSLATGKVTVDYAYLGAPEQMVAAPNMVTTEGSSLESFGMVEVRFREATTPLQFQGTARLSFPYAGAAVSPNGLMGLYSFDPTQGAWRHEGQGMVVDRRFVADVTHFSWWNADQPLITGCVRGSGPAEVVIRATGIDFNAVSGATTSTEGKYCMPVRVGSRIRAEAPAIAWEEVFQVPSTVGSCGLPESCAVLNVTVPPGWHCPLSQWASGDGCHCDCGTIDPDCRDLSQPVVGCSAAEYCNDAGICTAASCNPVAFSDPGVEAAVRDTLGVPTGALPPGRVAAIRTLGAAGRSIASLGGLSCLSNLKRLDLRNNALSELAGLDGLSSLRQVDVSLNPFACWIERPRLDELAERQVSVTHDCALPTTWNCPNSHYESRDGCDCGCGAPDRDCAFPAQTVWGCSPGIACSASGVCANCEGTLSFGSPLIENAVRSALGRPTGDITGESAASVSGLMLTNACGGTTALGSLAGVECLGALGGIDADGCGITDISGLQGRRLRSVSLRDNPLSDISVLRGMPLESVRLDRTQVTDLSALTSALGLESISLRGTPITDLSSLANHPNLVTLDLDSSSIVDLAPLATLPALDGLWVKNTKIVNLAPLANHPNLTYADLRNTLVTDLSPLTTIPSLETINAQGTPVASLPSFAANTKLTTINLSDTQVTDVTELGRWAAARSNQYPSIYLANTPVTDIKPLLVASRIWFLSILGTKVPCDETIAELRNRGVDLRTDCP